MLEFVFPGVEILLVLLERRELLLNQLFLLLFRQRLPVQSLVRTHLLQSLISDLLLIVDLKLVRFVDGACSCNLLGVNLFIV